MSEYAETERKKEGMKQTVLITGNNGFIGSYLQKRLQGSYNVIGISRQTGTDIADYTTFKAPECKIDVIVHAAAAACDDFETAFQTNVVGTRNICRYAKEHGIVRVVLLSSIFAFDKPDNGYFNSYGRTKKLSEEVALGYCREHGIDLSILRLAQVYDDKRLAAEGQAMLYYFIDTIRTSKQITLFGRSNPIRNYIHIDYLCSVVEEVIGGTKSGTWNVLEEKSHTIAEIAYMVFEVVGTIPEIAYLPEKPDIPSVHIPATQQYVSESTRSISLKEGIERILHEAR